MDNFNEILAAVPGEDAAITSFEVGEKVEENQPTDSPTETKTEEEAPPSDGATNNQSEEKSPPFHEHPRWREREKRLKQMESDFQSERAARMELETKLSNLNVPAKDSEELPDDFVKLYGDNHEAYKLWNKQQNDLAERIKSDIYAESEAKTQAERQAIADGENYVSESLQSLEDDGKKFDRNELMKFMLDTKEKYGAMPEDDRGNIDFARGYQMMIDMKGEKKDVAAAKARKDIATFSGDSGRGRGESAPKDYLTSNDLKNVGWDTLIGS